MKVGYIRVSTIEQNEGRQLETLKQYNVERLFMDKVSGKDTNRPQFQTMMDFLREGDELYISEFSRLSRSTKDLLETIETLHNKGVTVISNKEQFDTSSATGKLLLTLMAAINQFEREINHERTMEGIELAKKAGKYKGRQAKKYEPDLLKNVLEGLANKTMTVTEASKRLGVTRATVYNLLKRVGDNNDEYSETGRDSNDDNAVTI